MRQIASGARADVFATGEFERHVKVWSLADRRQIGESATILDFGGRRLALCECDGDPVVVAGAWERHGICGYGLNGDQLWQRSDLKKVQHLSWAAHGELVAACFDDGPMRVLDATSGETVDEVRAVREFSQSPFAESGAAELSGHVALIDTHTWTMRWKVPITGFAILAMAHAPGAIAAADVADVARERRGGPASGVSCFDLLGQRLWRWDAPNETNCPCIAWDEAAHEWVGVLHHVNRGAQDTLVRWSVDGQPVLQRPLGEFVECELPVKGRHLLTDKRIFDTKTGEVTWAYAA